jgi:hypothetical protein
MLGISREVTKHALKIRLGSRAVKQCLRHFDEKRRAIGEEIVKLWQPNSSRKCITPSG